MAGLLPPVIAELRASTDEFTAKMAEAKAEMEDVGHTSDGMSSKLSNVGKGLLLGIGAAAVGVGILSIDMADKFEVAHASMIAAMNAAHQPYKQWQSDIDATEKKMENLGFDNATVEASIASLDISTQNMGESLKLEGLAADIARAKHVDLGTATSALSKLMAGSSRALTQLGINLDIGSGKLTAIDTATRTVTTDQLALKDAQAEVNSGQLTGAQGAAALAAAHNSLSNAEYKLHQDQDTVSKSLDALNQRLGGQAIAYTHTFGGEMAVLEARAEDLAKNLGLMLIPKLELLIRDTISVVDWFAKHKAAAIALGAAITAGLAVPIGVYLVNSIDSAITSITKAQATFGKWVGSITGSTPEITEAGTDITTSSESVATTMSETAASFQASLAEMTDAMTTSAAAMREQLASVGAQAQTTAAEVQAAAGEMEASAAEARGAGALSGAGTAVGGAEAAVGAGEAAVGTGEAAVGAGEAGVGAGEIGAGAAGVGISTAVVSAAVALAIPAGLAYLAKTETLGEKAAMTKGYAERAKENPAHPGLGRPGFGVGNYGPAAVVDLTPLQKAMDSMKSEVSKDKTIGAQSALLSRLEADATWMKAAYGANSPQAIKAMNALQSTADKWLPGASKDQSLKGIYDTVSKEREALDVLKGSQQFLAKDETMKATRDQITEANDKLKGLRSTLATEKTLGASAQAIQLTHSEIVNTTAAVRVATGHIDALKSVAAQITKAQDTINMQTKLAAEIEKVNTATSGLKADIEKGINIAQLPQRNSKLTGRISLVVS